MIHISVTELSLKMKLKEDIMLVDVREAWEHEQFNLGGILIPLPTVMEFAGNLERHRPVIFYCQKGIRSQIAIQRLEQKYKFTNLCNLTGGIEAWIKEKGK